MHTNHFRQVAAERRQVQAGGSLHSAAVMCSASLCHAVVPRTLFLAAGHLGRVCLAVHHPLLVVNGVADPCGTSCCAGQICDCANGQWTINRHRLPIMCTPHSRVTAN